MIFQASDAILYVVFILIATVILWLCIWLATRLIVSKTFASDKKIALLIAALLIVIVVPLISGAIGSVLNLIGNALADLRTLIYPHGVNHLGALTSVIEFLLILIVLKLIVRLEWKDAVWIALIALFFLYIILTLLPELGVFPFF
jgi:hypothetical protein